MSRASLAEQFASPSSAPCKTFVLEAHVPTGDPKAYLSGVVGDTGTVEATEDRFLFRLRTEAVELWVDTLEDRFWSFHTWSPVSQASPYLKDRVERRRDLDFAWLPSEHLRGVWPGASVSLIGADFGSHARGVSLLPADVRANDFRLEIRGASSDEVLETLLHGHEDFASSVSFGKVALDVTEDAFGFAREAIDRMGRFVAQGDSFELHQEVVRAVVHRYARLIAAVERRRLLYKSVTDEGGWRPLGSAILLRFWREVPDMALFLSGLFSSREPFRLWGIPRQLDDDLYEVEAVDLHVGKRLTIEVAPAWMRVYLPDGACGNTVARLVANLQHRFDARIRFGDSELQQALELTPQPSRRLAG